MKPFSVIGYNFRRKQLFQYHFASLFNWGGGEGWGEGFVKARRDAIAQKEITSEIDSVTKYFFQ